MSKKNQKVKIKPEVVIETPILSKPSFNHQLVLGGLAILIFIIYAKVWQNGFVWDDDPYIKLNEAVKTFDLNALLTGFHVGNYHPLTMLSLAIEYLLVGEAPWLFHLNNLVLHALNSFMLFKIFDYLKFDSKVSILLAVLFAVHPLHVESVAWAAERKDVLYTFFLLSSFWFYLRFRQESKKVFYVFALFLFVASCLSKGMAVVLPALLAITDWWILKKPFSKNQVVLLLPFFAISLYFAYLATTAQVDAGADASSVIKAAFSFTERMKIVSYSFLFYWVKTLLPINLLPFYPYPTKIGNQIPTIFTLALLSLIVFLSVAFWLGRKNKLIWWAVAFFAISISTVIQLIPVGSAIVADRYYYLSSIGPLFLIAYGLNKLSLKTYAINYLAIGLIGIYSFSAFFQTGHWKNLYTLFKPAEAAYPEDAMVLSNLGWYYLGEKDFPMSKSYLMRSDINGFKNADVCRTIGSMFIDEGDYEKALNYLASAQNYLPKSPRTDWLTGLAYSKLNQFDKALPFCESAVRQDPKDVSYKVTLSSAYIELGKYDEAIAINNEILKLEPTNIETQLNNTYLYKKKGNVAEEINQLVILLKDNPSYLPAYKNIGVSLTELGRNDEAVRYWEKAAAFDKVGDFEYNIGVNHAIRGNIPEAQKWYIKAAKKGKPEAINILKERGVSY